jgi:hypothetical protein
VNARKSLKICKTHPHKLPSQTYPGQAQIAYEDALEDLQSSSFTRQPGNPRRLKPNDFAKTLLDSAEELFEVCPTC